MIRYLNNIVNAIRGIELEPKPSLVYVESNPSTWLKILNEHSELMIVMIEPWGSTTEVKSGSFVYVHVPSRGMPEITATDDNFLTVYGGDIVLDADLTVIYDFGDPIGQRPPDCDVSLSDSPDQPEADSTEHIP